ncbi:hypothetical protein KGM_215144 [Danaus plexippus plexippus]|uniref:F-box domain-containing protein n=1 Tax=Danaus plexippus plexippus TaxID=278856 RepID=A0A212EKB9_DANPL|nr:hypothetical protein KGM_215144 [Danaus plexippus plexippus]
MIQDTESFIQNFPTELLLYIFKTLLPKNLAICRQVCLRWKNIIDSLFSCGSLWRKQCIIEYPDIYEQTYYKRKPGLVWAHIYRSLTLWSKLHLAIETRDEFASASRPRDEVRNFQVLQNGLIGVHTRGGIYYYDLATLKLSPRNSVVGDYLRYMENAENIIILGFNLSLMVIKKIIRSQQDDDMTFQHVKLFILGDDKLFFVTLNDEVYMCSLSSPRLETVLLRRMDFSVMSLGYSNNNLNILTFQRDIFCIENHNLVYKCTLDSSCNLLHELNKFNFLENLDWRVYFQWMYVLNHSVPQGPLRDIIIVKTYGKITFVGSNWGVLRIYYNSYLNEEFDIFNTEPIKQYNFMERCDCPVLSMCPIIQIDVVEGEDSHKVIVAMPKKIALLTFTHEITPTSYPQDISYIKQ